MPRRVGKKKATAADCSSPILSDDDADYKDTAPTPTPSRRLPKKPPPSVQAQLHELDTAEKHPTTQSIITHALQIGRQTWTTFTLRYDQGSPRGNPNPPYDMNTFYAETTLSRWDLVSDILNLALLHQQVVETYGANYELYWSESGTTAQISEKLVGFIEDVLRRGEFKFPNGRKAEGIVVREWRRRGTWEVMSAGRVVPQEDLAEGRGEGEGGKKGYPLRIW